MASAANISSQLSYLRQHVGMGPFTVASIRAGVPRNLLLAVASRESHMGQLLDANYLGDGGNGMGIMQIDRRYHPGFAASVHPSDHSKNVLKGAQILKEEISRFNGNVYAALAAYNSGATNVQNAIRYGLDADYYTTGKDYAKDVLSRYEIINQVAEPTMAGWNTALAVIYVSALAGTAYLIVKENKRWNQDL
jgi:soluble lytic murein transglycosylase-like protein